MKGSGVALAASFAASIASAQPAPRPAPYPPPGAAPTYGGPYAPPAYAPAPYYAPAPVVPVWISSEVQGPTYELRRPNEGSAVFFCRSAACAAYLPIGEYDVYVSPTDDYAEGKRRVKIERPSQLVIEPRDASARTTGLAMGVGGTVLVAASFTMLIAMAGRSCTDVSCDEQRDTVLLLSLGGIIAGSILTPVGWVRYGKSFRPGVQVIDK